MFFGIAGRPDAEVRGIGVEQVLFQVLAFVHVLDLADQVDRE